MAVNAPARDPGSTQTQLPSANASSADPFFWLAIGFAFATVLLGELIATLLYAIVLVLLFSFPLFWRKRHDLPSWLSGPMEAAVTRVLAFPPTILIVPILGLLVLTKWLPLDSTRWRELILAVVMAIAFWLSRRGSQLLLGVSRARHAPPPTPIVDDLPPAAAPRPPPEPGSQTSHGEAIEEEIIDVHRRAWEERQQKRWEEWMQEELDRLDGEYKSDH